MKVIFRTVSMFFPALLSIVIVSGQVVQVSKVSRQPYYRYVLPVTSSDSIVFYLSEEPDNSKLPLIVYVQGSGNESLFIKNNEGRIIPRSGHINFAEQTKGRCRVLIVEKPGVISYQKAGSNEKFDQLFSLQNWQEKIKLSIDYTLRYKPTDTSKVMIVGHSEGGVIAASLARLLPDLITHVAIMAGEGLTQLFSLYQLAEQGSFFDAPGKNQNQRIDSLLTQWRDILKDPKSTVKKFWGFTYLRWSSFLTTSVYDELSDWDGKILILQGDRDVHVSPLNAKALFTGLLSKDKNVILEMIEGADHSFNISNQTTNGWDFVIEKSINWFLKTGV